ncbi:cyclic nucleotide-binding domain-containing protein [Kitasatospora sp. GP82]|uniref:NAD(P)/FAD-dependent oxidoreductase n=1 Tax=Kitasatospora sp. GP82 TaxID=3035089 RepID=UPI002476958D|nr:cyclic nucleotide-binding domain-containing protein [Kitasatospora sp. GP82]MDH6124837.1 thioredoxin reductase [Kitasatospora sp. GP82]
MTTDQPTPAPTPDPYGAFPRLTDDQIAVLSASGQRRQVREGDLLYREGEPSREFFVVLSGTVAVVEGHGEQEKTLQLHGPGSFLGELGLAATLWEARACRLDPVAVVGGGNSAGQAALFLAAQSPTVHLLVRGGDLAAGMSRYLVDRITQHPRIEVMLHTEVQEVTGTDRVESVVVRDKRSGGQRALEVHALFVFIGAPPHLLARRHHPPRPARLDPHRTGLAGAAPAELWHHLARTPFALETDRPGILAADDVRSGSVKRVASAVGEGSMAVRLVHEHLREVGSPGIR